MDNLIRDLLIDEISAIEEEEELDQSLGTILPITPPTTLVASIMAAVAHLPLPEAADATTLWDDLDVLDITFEPQCLC